MHDSVVIILGFCIALSSVCELLLIIGFLKVNQLKEHPGVLIFIQCINQLILDVHWITVVYQSNHHLKNVCKTIGAITVVSFVVSTFYTFFLCLEVYYKIKIPRQTHSKRIIIYHSTAALASIIVFIVLITGHQNGESCLNTCSIQSGTIYELIFDFLFFIVLPMTFALLLYCLFMIKKYPIYSPILKYHLYVVIGFIVSYGPGFFIHSFSWEELRVSLLSQEWFIELSLILGSLCGVITFACRLSQKGLLKYLLVSIFHKTQNNRKIRAISLIPYPKLFDILEKNADIQKVINSLDFVYKNTSNPDKITEDDREWEIIDEAGGGRLQIVEKKYKLFQKVFLSKGIKLEELADSFDYINNFNDFKDRVLYENDTCFGYTTYDNKYLIRTLSQEEFEQFNVILKDYTKRIKDKDSFLLNVYGLFTIAYNTTQKVHFRITENIKSCFKNPEEVILIKIDDSKESEINKTGEESVLLDSDKSLSFIMEESLDIYKVIEKDLMCISQFPFVNYSLKHIYDVERSYLQYNRKLLKIDEKFGYLFIDFSFGKTKKSIKHRTADRKKFMEAFKDRFK